MNHQSITAIAFTAMTVAAASANADVRYDFTAVSSYNVNGEYITGSFSVVVPQLLVVNTRIDVAALTSCQASATKGGITSSVACEFENFYPTAYATNDQLGFAVAPTATNPIGIRSVNYYFEDGAFGTFGTHQTTEFGTDQFATLVVSQVSAVPEAASALTMVIGLGILAAGRRKNHTMLE